MKLEFVEVINDTESGDMQYEVSSWESIDHHVKMLEVKDANNHIISKSFTLDFSDIENQIGPMQAMKISLHKVE